MTAGDFPALLRRLASGGVEFVVIGGVAGAIHGSAHVTYDLDVLYRRTRENMVKLAAALEPVKPYLRGAAPGLPFRLDTPTLERGLNFTLTTLEGDVDLLGEAAGGGTYEQALDDTEIARIGDVEFRCISLRRLILLKRAAGRPKDMNMIAELEALLEERERGE